MTRAIGPAHETQFKIEDEARRLTVYLDCPPDKNQIKLSKAISLKRIADALEGSLTGSGFANLEQLAWSMGQAFERGRGAS